MQQINMPILSNILVLRELLRLIKAWHVNGGQFLFQGSIVICGPPLIVPGLWHCAAVGYKSKIHTTGYSCGWFHRGSESDFQDQTRSAAPTRSWLFDIMIGSSLFTCKKRWQTTDLHHYHYQQNMTTKWGATNPKQRVTKIMKRLRQPLELSWYNMIQLKCKC